jgi:hypothetical protein
VYDVSETCLCSSLTYINGIRTKHAFHQTIAVVRKKQMKTDEINFSINR